MNYPHTFPPYDHQDSEQKDHWDTEIRAMFWEQGLGKMKAGWDWALTNWQAGKINTFIVLAPNGVHRDWIEEGFKEPNPDNVYDQPLVPPMWHNKIEAKWYHGQKAGTKTHQASMRELFYTPKLAVLSMSFDSAKTKSQKKTSGWIGGKLFLEKMLKERGPAAFLLDESAAIQTPGSQITKTVVGHGGRGGLGRHAEMRRIMDGTPVDEGPFNIYSQMMFLDPEFWKDRGFASYASFKAYFGIFKTGFNSQTGREFPYCVGYQNLPELHKILAPHMSRLLKDDVLDLPPKIYSHVRFELSPEQRKAYNQLEEELYIMAKAEGQDVESLITAELPIVKILKLYQITAGYLPFTEEENGEPVDRIVEFKENPRLENALEYLNRRTGKTVIWCRFTRDIELLASALGKNAVRYDGKIDEDTRAANKTAWLKGDPQFLIPQIQAMAKGHTLNIAPDVLYYTNDSRLRLRRQSEDRTHRGVMKHSCTYADMFATDTVDEKRVKDLRKKLATAQAILGDDK